MIEHIDALSKALAKITHDKKLKAAIVYSKEVNYMRHDVYNQLHNIDSQIAEVIRSQ